jgi:3-phenylpropionate/trans-cinnamate dioxygenase ferredoxin reductase subunit
VQTGVAVCGVRNTTVGLVVETNGGREFAADLVVLGTGAAASSRLAAEAGLEVADGIIVDAANRTSDPAIFAIGDCCSQFHPRYGRHLRLESVQNAVDQAKAAAAAITGQPPPPVGIPWFWSDQYDVKLQMAGITGGSDRIVVRGRPELRQPFSAWHYRADRLLAVEAVNDAAAYVVAGKLLQADRSPSPEIIENPDLPLKNLLAPTVENPHA